MPKNEKSNWSEREASDRHEPVARWSTFFADAGFEAVHWSAVGAMAAADIDIMAFANAHAFTVVTHDLDFSAILAATQGEKPSVVQLRAEDVSPEIIGDLVISALKQLDAELQQGALVTVDPKRTRLRILPLGKRE